MSDEQIPIKSASEDVHTKKRSEEVIVISRTCAIVLVLIVIVIIIFVGVLSGVLSARQARKDEVAKRERREGISATKELSTTMTSPTSEPTGPEPWYKIRLPQNIRPVHYDFYLDPHLEENTFNGNVSILINVTAKSDFMSYVLVHIKDMDVNFAQVYRPARENSAIPGTEVPVKKTFLYPKNDFFVFELEKDLELGNYVLVMAYNSTFSSQLNGLYISTYKNEKGETRRLATTKFEPTDARKALPLFDEPALKATFSTVIFHDKDYTALSNMPVEHKKTLPNGRVASYFMKSVPMSTYLLAFIVCDFQFTNATTGVNNNITLRVWTTPAQVDQTKFALDVGKDIITYFEQYYQLGYPLPKQDMIAIPDFSSGAMENWGLITYRESRLLYQPGVSSESNKQSTAVVVSHELAHQWFGNIVSPKWWNDLWLNEGFASFVEYLGVNHTHPDWDMMEQFLLLDLQRVFPLDSLASSHPISVHVDHPKKIKQLFDRISYSKGSSIIRMLEGFLGRDVFKDGLSYYLKKYAFSNAETSDLWNTLGEVANIDVNLTMATWTYQMGFPVVTIKRSDKDQSKAVATQEHFLLDQNTTVDTVSPFHYRWYVPLTYVFQDSPQTPKLTWMKHFSEFVEFDWPQGKWIKANFKQKGYYRVNYEEDNWKALVKELNDSHEVFTSEDRSSLIDDAFNLARAGYLDYKIAMSTLQYLGKEKKYVPWKTALNSLGFLDSALSLRPAYGLFQKFIRIKVKPVADRLGWESKPGDRHIDKYLRSSILWAACGAGDLDALGNATRIFNEWMTGKRASIDVDLRTLVYYYGIANTGQKEWDWMFEKFLNTSEASEKSKLMYALAASRTPWILNRYLEYALDSSKVRSQDAVSVINYVASNPAGKYLAWNFVQDNWKTLFDMFSSSTFRLTSLTNAVTQFTTDGELRQMKGFFDRSEAGTSENARNQAIERVQVNIEWLKKNEDAITEWLNANVGA